MHGKVFKVGSKNSATFKMELFATIGKVKSCKGLHLICDKVLGSAPDFYVSSLYVINLTLNINMENN